MTDLIPGIEERLDGVVKRLEAAQQTYDRQVSLLAVSKTFPVEAVEIAWKHGVSAVGENYAQEGCEKYDAFFSRNPQAHLQWHFIGPLQANKTRMVAERFDWVQSVDRMRIAQRLNDQRPEGKGPLNVLIEVNIDDENSKSGVAPNEVLELATQIAKLPNLRLRGLMTIPAPADSHESRLVPLKAMRQLYDSMAAQFGFDTLSMGMSSDMVEAVEAGTTMVRVGSAIFGHRQYINR